MKTSGGYAPWRIFFKEQPILRGDFLLPLKISNIAATLLGGHFAKEQLI